MDQLLESSEECEPLQSRAQWHAEIGEWEQAAHCYQQLLNTRCGDNGNSGK